ncbi:DUF4040 domain-containing protein [Alkalinema sp. FACHB-956]|uniref:DUF4040 domain-containing protein n=1 Tax=Alkalinema sp. FACHB-956 TaxID=2692768 RepID=UPI001682608D|nr:DUF4040 domain-containing protein [Alkalinema sp. FACHB-956]
MTDYYIYWIVALMPLAALMVVVQANPYHALILRGALGAISALVYAMLGAADVALTEALVGTLLAVTLYVITVRSSLVFRLGILQQDESAMQVDQDGAKNQDFQQLLIALRRVFKSYYMQVEWVTYDDRDTLLQAMNHKEIHATWLPIAGSPLALRSAMEPSDGIAAAPAYAPAYALAVRLQRLHEILKAELDLPSTNLTYVDLSIAVSAGQSIDSIHSAKSQEIG